MMLRSLRKLYLIFSGSLLLAVLPATAPASISYHYCKEVSAEGGFGTLQSVKVISCARGAAIMNRYVEHVLNNGGSSAPYGFTCHVKNAHFKRDPNGHDIVTCTKGSGGVIFVVGP